MFELPDLAFKPRVFQSAVGNQHEPVGLKRFFDEIIGAMFDGSDGSLDVAVPGNHDHWKFGVLLFDSVQ